MRNPFGWSLPPGVTDRHIDEAAGAYDEYMPAPEEGEEAEAEAWEYWHGRAMSAETVLHQIRQLEPGTQEYVDGKPVDAVGILGEVFRIARTHNG